MPQSVGSAAIVSQRSAVEWGEVQGRAAEETNGFYKGRKKYTGIFQYGKKFTKGKDDSKNQHCKLEVIFTASHNRATKGTKLNYKTKGLRQTKILLTVRFSRLYKCTVKIIATECCEVKKYKNKFKEGWTESQEPIGGC